MNQKLLSTLMEIAKKMNSAVELEAILPSIIELAKEYIGVGRISVFLIEQNKLKLKAFAGFNPQLPVEVQIGEGITGAVAATGRICLVNHGESHFHEGNTEADYKATSFLSVPLVSGDKIIGVINFTDKNNDFFDTGDSQIAEYIASQCALAVERYNYFKKMQENEYLQAIGMMRASVAHDIRNLLGIVEIYLSMIEGSAEPENTQEYVSAIRTEVQRVQGLTLDMTEYAKQKFDLHYKDFNISALCGEISKQLSLSLKFTEVTVECDCPDGLMINADPERLYRVIFNLANNAVQAIHEKGTVLVRARERGENISLMVCDNGKGIPKEHIASIFDPFVTSGKAKGTGLGLAIVKEIVKAHSGSIKVRSEEGKYTIFRLRLPAK